MFYDQNGFERIEKNVLQFLVSPDGKNTTHVDFFEGEDLTFLNGKKTMVI